MLFHQSSIPMPVDALSAINLHASCWPVESTSMSLETGSLARMRVSRRSSIPSAWPEDQPELWGPVWSLQDPMGHGAAMGQWTEWTHSDTTAPCSCSWVGSAGTFPLSGSLRSQHHGLDASPPSTVGNTCLHKPQIAQTSIGRSTGMERSSLPIPQGALMRSIP